MSRAAKQSVIILIVLILAAMGFPSYTAGKRKNYQKEKLRLSIRSRIPFPRRKPTCWKIKIFKKKLAAVEKERPDLATEVERQFRREH